jgi:hypothetical protein
MSLLGIIASSKLGIKNYWDTIVDDGAVTAWKLTETTGSTITDFIASKTMTGYGTYTLNQTGVTGSTDITKAISYDGTSGYHQSATDAIFNVASTSNWSCEFWMKSSATDSTVRTPYAVRNGRVLGLAIQSVITTNKMSGLTYIPGPAELFITGTTSTNNGNWFHIVLTAQSGGSFYLYVNGVQEAVSATTRDSGTGNLYICIGANAVVPTQFFNGLIAAPAFYNTYLDATKVLDHYNKGIA